MVSTTPRRLRQLLRAAMGSEELGNLIRQAREEAGLTQATLAARIGLQHPQSVSRYERGETEVRAMRLRRIAEVTGKPISFFLGVTPTTAEEPGGDRLERLESQVAEVLAILRELRPSTRVGEAGRV